MEGEVHKGGIWDERLWFPENVSWSHLNSDGQTHVPQPRELLLMLPISVGLFLVRLAWEKYVARPLGLYYKVRSTPPTHPRPNQVLEEAFKRYGRLLPQNDIIVGLAKQSDWTPRQVERWWRRRKLLNKPTQLARFCETSWRCLFYTGIFFYGLWALWDKNWFWTTELCYKDWPRQHIDSEVWWYYQIELGFYCSLVISLFMDNKRKDFWEMIIHHICTIALLSISWCANMIRIGSLVILVHDAADPMLEGAKLLKYMAYDTLCDFMFIGFAVNWFVTRITLYPLRILYSSFVESWRIVGPYNMWYIFNGMLSILYVLHIFWFYTILKMAYYYIVYKELKKDERSDTEEDTDTEDEAIIDKPVGDVANGTAAAAAAAKSKSQYNNNSELLHNHKTD